MASLLSAACIAMGFLVLTMLTWMPLVNMGVMTMKMISRTSMTSTMGVTLISETGGWSAFFLKTIFMSLLPGTRQEWRTWESASGPDRRRHHLNQLAGFR